MLGALLGALPVAWAQDVTDAEAEALFAKAHKTYGVASGVSGTTPAGEMEKADAKDAAYAVEIFSNPNQQSIPGGEMPANVKLEDVRIVIDVEGVTLREVIGKIVSQAAPYTGPWTVKWRMKPENMDLLDERVNLTAEAKFGDFVNLLSERVRNMTGTTLFVTTFNDARVMIIADTAN